jgi:hypothetical protein
MTTTEIEPNVVTITFNSDNQARGLLAHFTKPDVPPAHDLILLGGGVNSGKTFLFGVGLDWRARPKEDGRGAAETDVLGALFVNSLTTFRTGLFNEIAKLFRKLGREAPTYNVRPPIAWQRRWAQQGIDIPAIPSYTGTMCTPDGVHIAVGSLHNVASMHQFETVQYGWAWVEEAINNPLNSNETVKERVRCAIGGQSNPDCARYHNHTTTWVFNPPRGAHPYLFQKLDDLENSARHYYHALRDGETCDGCFYVDEGGDEWPRHHGPELNHREWPLLSSGVGKAIWIRSRTSDNAANQNRGYRASLAGSMSKDTARRRLEGEILRETTGRAYTEFDNENVIPVRYDADRTLFLTMDFNLRPRAAGFWHPLNPGEYPSEHEREGITHVGKFGEYFYAGEMSDRKWAIDMVKGGRGSGCGVQPSYRIGGDEHRGLPPPCHKCDDDCNDPCEQRCEKVCRKGHWNGLRGHRGRIIAFGDQRGTHRSSHDDDLGSSLDIVNQVLRQLGNYGTDIPDVQPSPRARVDAVNGKLCNEMGIRSAWIDPRCEESIRDYEQVQWDADGKGLREWRHESGTESHRTHLSDGDGYFIVQRFPAGRDETDDDTPTVTRRKRPSRFRGGGSI